MTESLLSPPESAVSSDDRPVRPDDQLFAGVGHGSLRSALLLLHVGRHDIPAKGRSADARRARPAVFGIHRQGRAEVAADRRRTAGPAQRDVAGALAVAASQIRRTQRTDADDQWLATGALCQRTAGLRRTPHQRLDGHARSGEIPLHYPLGRSRQGAWPASRLPAPPVSPSRSMQLR